MIDIAYSDALSLLQQHRDKLDMIAQALLEKEKINEEDFQRFLKNNLEVAKIRNFHFGDFYRKKQNG